MSLNRIHIKNLKLIKEVTIQPGKVNQIVGENNMGKSTILEAIQFAMIGSTDESIISHGEKQTSVDLNFSDGLSVKRWLTRGSGQGLAVEMNDMTPQKPQSFLNGLVGVGTFNPKEVLDPKNRTDYFLKTIDLKVTKEQIEEVTGDIELPEINYDDHGLKVIQRAAQFFYDSRTIANKSLKKANVEANHYKDKLGELPVNKKIDASDEDLKQLIEGFKSGLKNLKQKHDEWVENKKCVNDNVDVIKGMKNKVHQLKCELVNEKQSLIDALKINRIHEEKLGPEPDIGKESAEFNEHIEFSTAEVSLRKEHDTYNNQHEFVDRLFERVAEFETESKNLGAIYKKLTQDLTEKIMGEADLPAKGLTFEDGDFKLDGVNVDQLSSSKTLSLALAVARKLSKKANLICVDGVELLDEATYNDLNKEMSKDNFNYFMAKVGPAFTNSNDKIIKMNNGAVQ